MDEFSKAPPRINSRVIGQPWRIATEYNFKRSLLCGVLIPHRELATTGRAIHETWGSGTEVSGFKLFVGGKKRIEESLNKLPIVHLNSVHDLNSYEQSLNLTFKALEHFYKYHVDDYKWFLLGTQNTYVAGRDLEKILEKMDHHKEVYAGRAFSEDEAQMSSLELGPQEFYCYGPSGILLSGAALKAVGPYLNQCFQLIQEVNSVRRRKRKKPFERGDVEFGRCLSRMLGITCSVSQEAQTYFYYDSEGHSSKTDDYWYLPEFQSLMTISPIMGHDHMRSFHYFVKLRELEYLKVWILKVEATTNQNCHLIPKELAPPTFELVARNCEASILNASCLHLQPFNTKSYEPVRPKTRNELQSWDYINSENYIFVEKSTFPVSKVTVNTAEELQYIVKKAIDIINIEEPSELHFCELKNTFVKDTGTQGRRYILDLDLWDSKGKKVPRRVQLLRPYQPEMISIPEKGSRDQLINFIVPLSKVNQRFMDFLKVYEQTCLKTQENVRLILVVYGEEDINFVNSVVDGYQKDYLDMLVTVVPGVGEFTRGRAIDYGLTLLKKNELAFLCDVDMTIERSFLNRCRLNAVKGERVYYPVFFTYYNMDYVYKFDKKPKTFNIARQHGHWVWYSYGMICIYYSDYLSIGGFDKSIVGWGGEDVDLFLKVLAHELEVVKAPDPALTHRWHPKYCSSSLTPKQYSDCLGTRNEALADKKELAEYILYLEEHYNIKNGDHTHL